MIRRIFVILLLLSLICGAVWYYALRPVGDLVITGIVTTDTVSVSSQVTGRIQELRVEQGALVKKGDLLAVIDAAQWQKDMSFFQQAEEQAKGQLAQAEAALRFEQAQTTSQIAQAQASLASAEAQITQAQADLENARLTFTHEETAYKSGAESLQMYDQARTSYESQKARAESIKSLRDVAKSAVDVAKSNAEQIAVRQAAVETAKHQLEGAVAQKEKAGVQLGYTDIKSPIDGIVDVRAHMQGEVISPADAIVTLIDQDKLWIRADVEESYVDRIHLNDTLPVRLPSGKTLEGRVFYRSVDADYATQRDVSRTKRDVKTFEIRLQCDNKDRILAVGMTAYVTLPAQKK